MLGPVKEIVTGRLTNRVCNKLGIGVNKEPQKIDSLTHDSRILLTAAILSDRSVSTPASAHQLHAAHISLLEELGINSSNVCISNILRYIEELFSAGIISGLRGTYGRFRLEHKNDLHKVTIMPATVLYLCPNQSHDLCSAFVGTI